jgi:hypothetical protein
MENNDVHSFAYELLQESKLQTKRWFAVVIVELLVLLSVTGLFVWYISLPVEEYSIEQDTDTGGNNYNIGGNYNGETENN